LLRPTRARPPQATRPRARCPFPRPRGDSTQEAARFFPARSRLEPDDLEGLDVDQALVGDLQLRDDGEREEAQRLEGRGELATELAHRGEARVRELDDLLEGRVREDPGDGQR